MFHGYDLDTLRRYDQLSAILQLKGDQLGMFSHLKARTAKLLQIVVGKVLLNASQMLRQRCALIHGQLDDLGLPVRTVSDEPQLAPLPQLACTRMLHQTFCLLPLGQRLLPTGRCVLDK
jgi:hypothetical protein